MHGNSDAQMMKDWTVVYYPDGNRECFPNNDIKQHVEGVDCPCVPQVEELKFGVLFFIHNSFDRREYTTELPN